jgi:hypothetical protein
MKYDTLMFNKGTILICEQSEHEGYNVFFEQIVS